MIPKFLCKIKDEEILEELQQIEQENEQKRIQEFEDRLAWEESVLNSTEPVEYCPECGDNLYHSGDTCFRCGFPHTNDNKFSELDFLDLDDMYGWLLSY